MLDHRSSSVTKLHSHKYDGYSAAESHEKENLTSSSSSYRSFEDEQQQQQTTTNTETPTQQDQQQQQNGGYVWRLSSGLVNSTTGVISGAFGLGYGGVKWVASKGYSAGEVVVDTTKNIVGKVPVAALKRKDKKE
ncbi:hypothetical protein HELRODRAFT_183761 [Helobdella robusta]|uniref:Uncharacterized protein n=1 Tax=Helobdella robusta TaxID=6412 RepID=T1FK60_HELRO|nr:hypothetical protein HELRODRAFT_183761 [Helobdella robusta]ESO10296.1 hypothetical protein HELRODRAFT_183761 [Helobdella robusta]